MAADKGAERHGRERDLAGRETCLFTLAEEATTARVAAKALGVVRDAMMSSMQQETEQKGMVMLLTRTSLASRALGGSCAHLNIAPLLGFNTQKMARDVV